METLPNYDAWKLSNGEGQDNYDHAHYCPRCENWWDCSKGEDCGFMPGVWPDYTEEKDKVRNALCCSIECAAEILNERLAS